MGRYDRNKARRNRGSRYDAPTETASRRPRSYSGINTFAVAIMVIAAAAGGFFIAKLEESRSRFEAVWAPLANLRQLLEPPAPPVSVPVSAAPKQAVPTAPNEDALQSLQLTEQIILPTLDSSDESVREAVTSAAPDLAPWLNTGQLIRKYLLIANDFSQGIRVAKHLSFVKFQQPFVAEQQNGVWVLAQQSYRRYDGLAHAVDTMNIPMLLDVYKKFRPLLLQVFSEFSYPDGYNLDDVFIKAATEILAAPVIDRPLLLVKASAQYKFADPELEGLNPVRKQMLRMGAENTRLIQNKLRILLGELANQGD